jgi:hypothetical protein
MWIRRALMAFGLAALSVAVVAGPAYACSCVPPPSDKQAIKAAYAVFSGTVVESNDPEAGQKVISSAAPIEYIFEVDAVAKGDVDERQSVHSARDSASCGFGFASGKRYLVFAYPGNGLSDAPDSDPQGDAIHTGLCSNTRELGPDEELPFETTSVAQGEPPPGGTPSDERGIDTAMIAMWAIVGGVALFSIWLARRPRGTES